MSTLTPFDDDESDRTSESGVAGIGPFPDRSTGGPPSQPLETAPKLGSDVGKVVNWARRFTLGLIAVPTVAVAGLGFWVGPYFLDDWRLDRIVAAAALDWRDFGQERARIRLQYELDHQRIGMQVSEENCKFELGEGQLSVSCGWGVDLGLPFTNRVLPLRFSSESIVLADGDLR